MKTAIITGTSSGLGEGFARALLDLGWKIYGISRRNASPELMSHENFQQIQMDLTKSLDQQLLHETIGEKKIDLLVNNAGMVVTGPADQWDHTEYVKFMHIHYEIPAELMAYFCHKMNGGQVINILTDSANIGWPNWSLYGATKAALLLHSRSFAQEFPNINVLTLHPCAFDSPMTEKVGPEAVSDRHNFMQIANIVTLFIQAITGLLGVPSGSSIVIHNNWEAEEMQELRKNEYIYNVDSEQLTKLPD
jgi:short-subunit dehydrogenase